MKLIHPIALFAFASVFIVAAHCGAAQPPIKIGASVSLTGSFAALGQNQFRGCQVCVKRADDKGGLEGRWDYACIGSVTNLAARLCGDAKGGQVLTNQKTLSRIEDAVEAAPLGEVMMKGIAQPVPVFNITAFKA